MLSRLNWHASSPTFLGHASAFEAAGARVAWVHPDPSDSVQQHAREVLASRALPSGFRITTDPDYGFTNAYGLGWDAAQETAYPDTFVIEALEKLPR